MTWQIPRWTGWVVWRKSEEPRVTHRWRFRTELLVMPFIEMGKLKGLWMAGRKWLLWKKWNTYYVYYVWDVSEAWKWKCLEAFRYANLDLTLGGGVCVCVCVLGWGCGWTQRPLEPFLISPEENWSLLLLHTSLFCIDFSHGICNFLKTKLSHSISLGVHWGHEKVLVLCINHSFLLTRWMVFLKEV